MPETIQREKRVCAHLKCGAILATDHIKGILCSVHERHNLLITSEATEGKKGKPKIDIKIIPFDELGKFWWPVVKYHIADSLILPVKPATKEDLKLRWYEPLKDRILPLRLAKVEEDNENDILKFVSEYGLLGQNQGRLVRGGETLTFFRSEIKNVRNLVCLYQAVEKGEDSLKNVITLEPRKGASLLLPEDYFECQINLEQVSTTYQKVKREKIEIKTKKVATTTNFIEKSQVTGENRLTKVANLVLANRIFQGMKLHGVYPAAKLTKEGKNLDPAYSFSNLIGAIYFQLYTTITKRWKYKHCKECKNLFFLQRADNNFCSAKCRSRYYTRRSRMNLKRREVKPK